MAPKPLKLWSQLRAATRKRKLSYYARQGLTPRQVASRYNAGSLGPQKATRGHRETPEHGLRQALESPGLYRKYLRKKNKPKYLGGEPPDKQEQAILHNEMLDKAYYSMRRLIEYAGYNDHTVLANVYGGETSESGEVGPMSYAQAYWTSKASVTEIRSMASDQYRGNPWFYH